MFLVLLFVHWVSNDYFSDYYWLSSGNCNGSWSVKKKVKSQYTSVHQFFSGHDILTLQVVLDKINAANHHQTTQIHKIPNIFLLASKTGKIQKSNFLAILCTNPKSWLAVKVKYNKRKQFDEKRWCNIVNEKFKYDNYHQNRINTSKLNNLCTIWLL